jgi:hypothetical protein
VRRCNFSSTYLLSNEIRINPRIRKKVPFKTGRITPTTPIDKKKLPSTQLMILGIKISRTPRDTKKLPISDRRSLRGDDIVSRKLFM